MAKSLGVADSGGSRIERQDRAQAALPPEHESRSPERFKDAYRRILEATGAGSQTELADLLDVRQSSISDATSRGNGIPANWLVTLTEKCALNPRWIKTGEGAQYLRPTDDGPPRTLRDYSSEALFAELVRRFRPLITPATSEDT